MTNDLQAKKAERLNNLKKRLEKKRADKLKLVEESGSADEEVSSKVAQDLMDIDREEQEESSKIETETMDEIRTKREKILEVIKDQYAFQSNRLDDELEMKREKQKNDLKAR